MSPLHGVRCETAPDAARCAALRALLAEAFASMEGRIDPPSSLHRLTLEDIARQTETGRILSIDSAEGLPLACLFLTPKADCLYLGKLAVSRSARGHGMARALIEAAEQEACARHLPALMLQTRVELTENHATFERLGFTRTAATAHPGYDRPTSYTYVRACAPQPLDGTLPSGKGSPAPTERPEDDRAKPRGS